MASDAAPRPPAAVGTIIVRTRDMDRLARFYAAGLGLPAFAALGPKHLGQRLGAVYLGFDAVDGQLGTPPGAVTLWFTVPDLEAAFARFVALGAETQLPPTEKPWGDRIAAVLDPDGNIVGLSQAR